MSNIGKQPVIVPDGVDVNINGTNIKVKGSLGELDLDFNSNMLISYDDNKISVKRPSDEKKI